MLFILEVFLTIAAWRRGWGARALLPVGIVFGIGMILGVFIVGTGGNLNSIPAGFAIFDLIATVVLGVMAVKAPAEDEAYPFAKPLANKTPFVAADEHKNAA